MIQRQLLENWAERTLRFANLPAGFGDAEAEATLTGYTPADLRLAPPGEFGPWHAPERGYAELHRDWRTFLRALCKGGGMVPAMVRGSVDDAIW